MVKDTPECFIPFDKMEKSFTDHLQEKPQNIRILFSGIYGSGKTTFLQDYFQKKNEKYNTFHLFPVNYQVADNKDVFELIKYDILTILMENEWLVKDEKLGEFLSLQSYIMNDGANLAWDILKQLPKLGKAFESIEKIASFVDNFNQYHQNVNAFKSNSVKKYLNSFNAQKGSIHEFDSITTLIKESLVVQKEAGKEVGKENILILDDLDRMDPGHIFRILNVFAAHFDQVRKTGEGTNLPNNKFGFDKIILVCDVDNLRSLFYSFYGENAEFGGYIDKFFSFRVFNFSMRNAINDSIDKILEPYQINPQDNQHPLFDYALWLKRFISDIITNNNLNFRLINKLQLTDKNLDTHFFIPNQNGEMFYSYNFRMIPIILFIYNVFGKDFDKLIKAIGNVQSNIKSKNTASSRAFLDDIAPLLVQDNLKTGEEYSVDINSEYKNMSFKIIDPTGRYIYKAEFVNEEQYSILDHINVYRFLELALQNMRKQGYFS